MAAPSPPESLQEPPPQELETLTKPLTIKIATSGAYSGEKSAPISPGLLSPHFKLSPESSVYNSPSIISPPSSAFVSALQSPYISPRASILPVPPVNPTPPTHPSPISYCGSQSDDVPSTSYTPPPERLDFSDDPSYQKAKFASCIPVTESAPPRISFSFPVPRLSFAKGSVSPASNAKLRSCDVYIGYHGQSLSLVRFCKWLKSELEIRGIASFVADRAIYSDTQSHEIADRIICSATFGIIVVTAASFLNPLTTEEIKFFAQKKNLIPLLFDTDSSEIARLLDRNSDDKEWREAIDGLMKCQEFKLEANATNWRNCISRAVGILKSKLGRRSSAEKEVEGLEEIAFPRNRLFVGREKELQEIESSLFGSNGCLENDNSSRRVSNGFSDGFADEDSDTVKTRGRYISLEMRKCKEPTLEAWIDPVIELSNKGRSPQKQRLKHKKSKSYKNNCDSNVVCISGSSGTGKTELALEFAYRYSQRYKMVLWVGGEARYFRQNILNLSLNLGLDVSAEAEKERGRIRSFDEQEFDAFQRVKRELFRDIPYLLIIDNLETEKEWWEEKDLHDLIPRNTGATHVIVTTRLPKVMNFEPTPLMPLPLADAMVLLKGKRRKDYNSDELDVLKKFDERLGRMSFGLWLVGSILSELIISPSALFDAINRIPLSESLCSLNGAEEFFCRNNPFLLKTLEFCFTVLDQINTRSNLAMRMVLSGAWFAPAPTPVALIAAAAKKISTKGKGFDQWKTLVAKAFWSSWCVVPQARRSESESALLIVKLGLARRTNRQPGCWIQFHEITQIFAKRKGGMPAAKATIHSVGKIGNPAVNSDHLWASAFLVFGFKCEPPLIQLKAIDMVVFIKKTALPLAIRSFMTFSRCNSALELLKVCTNVLEEVEKSFVSQIQDWCHGSLCWKQRLQSAHRVDEYVWQDVTLLKATLLETRAKLLLRGGHFDSGEELCRTCISIRTVMLGHNHALTLAAQETLAKLVRLRSKIGSSPH